MNMNQVTKKTATQQAMENLITYISGDTVQVGDKIPNEKDLCISLGVGRGTIREAVKVLISQGYLEIKPGLGTYVKSKTRQQGDSLSNWFFANEVAIQDIIIVRATLEPLATAMAIERCTPEQLEALQQQAAAVYVDDRLYYYAASVSRATREHPQAVLGVSPRGTLALIQSAKAMAMLRGRDYLLPDDIMPLCQDVLAHRILTKGGVAAEQVLDEVLHQVPAPMPDRR